MKKDVSQVILKECLLYRPTTGTFIWLSDKGQRGAGKIAGGVDANTGYTRIRLKGKLYQAHRLAYLYVHGEMPKYIDHINGERTDNRIENLRSATSKQNNQNRVGVTGVTWCKVRHMYRAQIGVDYKTIHLGYFCEYSEALNARKNAEVLYDFNSRKEI